MKLYSFLLALILVPSSLAFSNPVETGEGTFRGTEGTSSGGSLMTDPNKENNSMGASGLRVTAESKVTTSAHRLPNVLTRPIVVERDDLLKAIDAALNAEDVEIVIDENPVAIRPQSFDLKKGLLRGRDLETHKAILLQDRSKMAE